MHATRRALSSIVRSQAGQHADRSEQREVACGAPWDWLPSGVGLDAASAGGCHSECARVRMDPRSNLRARRHLFRVTMELRCSMHSQQKECQRMTRCHITWGVSAAESKLRARNGCLGGCRHRGDGMHLGRGVFWGFQ